MYSSNGSHNGNIDPVFYTDQQVYPFCCSPLLFPNDSNPTSNSKQPNSLPFPLPLPLPLTPLTFSHDSSFPSPFEDNNNNSDAIFHHYQDQLLLHHHQPLAEAAIVDMDIEVPSTGSTSAKQIPRGRRCCRSSNKRDRHSKIKTARGIRDRRMRLSIEVAKRFFWLQDMLGFDKASKTVDWLLNQAKEGIKRVARDKNLVIRSTSNNSTSECEGVSISWLDEAGTNGDQKEVKPSIRRKIGVSRKGTFHVFARESRVKARERARERTKEKMKSRKVAGDASKQNWSSNWNLLAKGEESNTHSQNVNSSLDLMTEAEEPSSQARENLWTMDISDDSLMSKWSPSMIFNPLHNSGFLHEVSSIL